MKKITFLLVAVLFSTMSWAQCASGPAYQGAVASNDGNAITLTACAFAGEHSPVTGGMIIGNDYEFVGTGGTGNYLTFTDSSGNVIAHGPSPLTVNAITVTSGRVYVSTNAACGTDFSCHTLTVRCVSATCTPPPPPANDECANAIALTVNGDENCGSVTAGTLASATDSGVTGSTCGGTDDDDVWFSFVATSTSHIINLDNVAGSTTDLYHAVYDAAAGCGTLGAAILCSDPEQSVVTGLTIGQTYLLQVYSWTATPNQNSTFDVCIGSASPEPECAITPFPTDGAIDVPAGDLTFSWSAPASGPAPTSYNVYAFDDAAGTNPGLIGNYTTTSADLTINVFDTEIFWAAVPVNGTTEATGCDVWSFTTQSYPGYCLIATYGLYPAATFTPSVCDGTTANTIVANAFASEYSNVQVTAGQTYQFRSSAPDFITISYDGVAVDASGVTPVTWTATTDGVVRFYTNLDDGNCGSAAVNRTKSVLCGPSLGVDEFDITALKVYPNPVKDVLNLSYTTEISSVAVYNMLGQVVLTKTVNANQESLNMSKLNAGAYFVKVTINDRVETVRVIKQ